MRSIWDVVRSRRFQREVSVLLFIFAAGNALFCVVLFAARGAGDAPSSAIVYGLQAVIYLVLGILIRRGSATVLLLTGLLFAIDTILTLFGPSWADARAVFIGRGLLLLVLYRFVRRERMRPTVTTTAEDFRSRS